MAPISSSTILTFLAVTASTSPTLAFTNVVVSPSHASSIRQVATPLHATAQAQESFQRSLLAARIAFESAKRDAEVVSEAEELVEAMEAVTQEPVVVAVASPVVVDTKKQESFQRSLLEARIANDAKAATLAASMAVEPDVAAAAPVVEDVEAKIVEPEPEQPVVAAAAVASTPEPEPVTAPPPPEAEAAAATTTTTTTVATPKPTTFTIPRELSIIPINEASVQFTAGLLGATAGYLLGGPIFAALLAATSNYLSRKDEEPTKPGSSSADTSAKKIVDTASQTALLAYNFLAKFEKDNKVFDTTFRVLEGAVDKVKQTKGSASSAITGIENTLGTVAKTVEELNDDYDLVGGAGTVLNSVGDLVEISVDKVVELDGEYRLSERMGSVVKGGLKKFVGGDDKK